MKIIFLDIDGVLNSSEYRTQMGLGYLSHIIDSRKMPLLKSIVDATDARIVLSTSWRKFWKEGEPQADPVGQYINEIFAEYGLTVYSKTPVIENAERDREIKAWLDRNRYIDSYVILDDQNFMWSPERRAHFVQTDLSGKGLEEDQIPVVTDILNGNLPETAADVSRDGLPGSVLPVLGSFFRRNRRKQEN